MNFSDKFKIFFKQKEGRQDVLYVLATILIIGIIAALFVWAMSIVYKAADAAFFISQKDIGEDILKFDFEGFKKIAPRLRIDFEPNQASESAVETPVSQPAPEQTIIPEIATTTEEIPVDVSLISLEILNGTATKGLAADWKNKFVSTGFLEANIKTGNADKKDYSGVTVYHNSDEKILAKINAVFSRNSVSAKNEIDSKLNALSFTIIIGK